MYLLVPYHIYFTVGRPSVSWEVSPISTFLVLLLTFRLLPAQVISSFLGRLAQIPILFSCEMRSSVVEEKNYISYISDRKNTQAHSPSAALNAEKEFQLHCLVNLHVCIELSKMKIRRKDFQWNSWRPQLDIVPPRICS